MRNIYELLAVRTIVNAAGLILATAACVTALDPGKINRLADTSGMKSEVVIPHSRGTFTIMPSAPWE